MKEAWYRKAGLGYFISFLMPIPKKEQYVKYRPPLF